MTRPLFLGSAALVLAVAAPAWAATATLTSRLSVSHIELIAGYGPASISFSSAL